MLLAACGDGNPGTSSSTKSQPPAATPSPTPKPAPKTAEQFVQALKDVGMSIGDVKVYTAESDDLLGRPGQYTSKADFKDTRIGADKLTGIINQSVSPGGSIEVFASADDLKARIKLIETITKSLSVPEYDYQHDVVLLRVSGILTPDQAKEYEAKFMAL
jgi:hypothetical protein